jgi:hypothetical protein
MGAQPPELIAIHHDGYHARHVGCTADGLQFFVTTPFVPASGDNPGREFIAVYRFDKNGLLVDAGIDDLGPRAGLDRGKARGLLEQRINELGRLEHRGIQVRPFEIERFGTKFGLVPRPPEDEEDSWWVEVQPGNYMAFHEPWDSGEYDT